jgi:hypothetical protein
VSGRGGGESNGERGSGLAAEAFEAVFAAQRLSSSFLEVRVMKSMLLSAVAVFGLAFAVGCTTTTTDGSGGGGGEGGGGDGGNGATTTSNVTTTTSSGGAQTCEQVAPACEGDGMDPSSGCFECSIIGDSTIATDGGLCADSYVACFGTDGSGTGATSQACVDLLGCLDACEAQFPDTESVEYLNCLCTNDGTQCTQGQTDPNTCLGADTNLEGLTALFAFQDCVTVEVCPTACGE